MSKKTKNKNNLYVKNINANTITFYLINYINQDNYMFSLSNKLLEVLSTNININIDTHSTFDLVVCSSSLLILIILIAALVLSHILVLKLSIRLH